MNDMPQHDDALERLLLRTGIDPVADDGFSDRVLSALPPRRRRRQALVPGIAAVIGASLAAWQLSGAALVQATAIEWQAGALGPAGTAVLSSVIALGAGLVGWAMTEK